MIFTHCCVVSVALNNAYCCVVSVGVSDGGFKYLFNSVASLDAAQNSLLASAKKQVKSDIPVFIERGNCLVKQVMYLYTAARSCCLFLLTPPFFRA